MIDPTAPTLPAPPDGVDFAVLLQAQIAATLLASEVARLGIRNVGPADVDAAADLAGQLLTRALLDRAGIDAAEVEEAAILEIEANRPGAAS